VEASQPQSPCLRHSGSIPRFALFPVLFRHGPARRDQRFLVWPSSTFLSLSCPVSASHAMDISACGRSPGIFMKELYIYFALMDPNSILLGRPLSAVGFSSTQPPFGLLLLLGAAYSCSTVTPRLRHGFTTAAPQAVQLHLDLASTAAPQLHHSCATIPPLSATPQPQLHHRQPRRSWLQRSQPRSALLLAAAPHPRSGCSTAPPFASTRLMASRRLHHARASRLVIRPQDASVGHPPAGCIGWSSARRILRLVIRPQDASVGHPPAGCS
jgi:hypothetical protein